VLEFPDKREDKQCVFVVHDFEHAYVWPWDCSQKCVAVIACEAVLVMVILTSSFQYVGECGLKGEERK